QHDRGEGDGDGGAGRGAVVGGGGHGTLLCVTKGVRWAARQSSAATINGGATGCPTATVARTAATAKAIAIDRRGGRRAASTRRAGAGTAASTASRSRAKHRAGTCARRCAC